jgi:GT2 family glycosyltransferase
MATLARQAAAAVDGEQPMNTVDVIVPCFNYGPLLSDCVASVLTQQGVRVRVLVMDDASEDETPQVGRRLAAEDSRVEYFRHDVNRGHIATYNEALAMVTADYCVILSADDVLTPGSLLRAAQCMEANPQVGLTYGRDITFRGTPPMHAVRPASGDVRIMHYMEFLGAACRRGDTGIQAPAAVVRSSLHRIVGGYRAELPHSGDTEIWLRLASHAAVAEIDADQAFRRLHAANMSLRYSPLRRLEEQRRAFATHFEDQAWLQPESSTFSRVLHRTLADAAFWYAAQAFADGDEPECEAGLAFASRVSPEIATSDAWRRLRWKRTIGRSAWRVLEPIAVGAREMARALPRALSAGRAR